MIRQCTINIDFNPNWNKIADNYENQSHQAPSAAAVSGFRVVFISKLFGTAMRKKLKSWALLLTVFILSVSGSYAQEELSGQDRSGAEIHYLSYQALSNVADLIVVRLLEKSPGANSLIICGSDECNDLIQARLGYEVFAKEADALIDEYESLDTPLSEIIARLEEMRADDERDGGEVQILASGTGDPITGATTAIKDIEGLITQSGSAVSTVFGLINLFRRTEIRVESSSVLVDDSVLTTAIVSRLKSRPDTAGIKVYLPLFAQMENVDVTDSEVFKAYETLRNRFRTALVYDDFFKRYSEVRISNSDADEIASLKTLNQRTVAFLNGLSRSSSQTADTTSGEAPALVSAASGPDYEILENLMIGERFGSMLAEKGMILRVKVIRLIGTRLTKNNLIMGKRIRFSGSATVQYVLTDNNGDLIYANTEIIHTGFKKMSEIRDQ